MKILLVLAITVIEMIFITLLCFGVYHLTNDLKFIYGALIGMFFINSLINNYYFMD